MDGPCEKSPANERCARCGAEFTCGAKAGESSCWCMELPQVMPVGADSCLCPDCLKAEIAKKEAGEGTSSK